MTIYQLANRCVCWLRWCVTAPRRLHWSYNPFLACMLSGRCFTHSWVALSWPEIVEIHWYCARHNWDAHACVAARMFNVLPKSVTPSQRERAKTYALMKQYGAESSTIVKKMECK